MRETLIRAQRDGVRVLRYGSDEVPDSKNYELLKRFTDVAPRSHYGLEFAFDHTPVDSLYENRLCRTLHFRTSSGNVLEYDTDFIVSCAGYVSTFPSIKTNVPVHKIGWIARNCKGSLADSMIDSQGALKFVKNLQPSRNLRDLDDSKSRKLKKQLEDFWLYENAMSSLMRRPWSYPSAENTKNALTHQFLEKLTRY